MIGRAQSKTFNLTIATGHPPVISWVRLLRDFFVPEVDRRLQPTGLRIHWNQAYGGTITKIGTELESIEKGLVDLAIVGNVFHPAKLGLLNVTYATPFVSSDVKTVVEVMDTLYARVPAMSSLWQRSGATFLCGMGVDSFHLFTKRPVASLSEIKGMKIGGAGPNLNWLRGSGAAGVVATPGTIYNDLMSGIYDGILLFASNAASIKLNEAAPHMLKIDFGAAYWAGLVANEASLKALPPEVQKVIRDVANEYRTRLLDEQASLAVGGIGRMTAAGLKVTEVDRNARIAWAASLPDLAGEWAAALQSKGLPARQVLSLYIDGVRARGQEIARNWDRA